MTNEEIDEKIAKLEKAIASPATPPDQKKQFEGIIEKLKAAKTQPSPPAEPKKEEPPVAAEKTRYSITNEIYPPKYSVVRIIGAKDGYSHEKDFVKKSKAIEYISGLGGEYEAGWWKNHYPKEKTAPATKNKTDLERNAHKGIMGERATKELETGKKGAVNYNCDELIAKEKERKKNAKAAAAQRANAPKHTPGTKNKIAIEKVGERVVSNVKRRIEKGDVKRAELEKLIKTTENVLKELKAALKNL